MKKKIRRKAKEIKKVPPEGDPWGSYCAVRDLDQYIGTLFYMITELKEKDLLSAMALASLQSRLEETRRMIYENLPETLREMIDKIDANRDSKDPWLHR